MNQHSSYRFSTSPLFITKSAAFGICIALGILIAGCGNKENKTVQTLARVNGEDITILQFNDELSYINTDETDKNTLSKQVLDKLIDRKLLAEAALENRLNRSPEVILSIERAKTQILEKAYITHLVNNQPEPGKEEISIYYSQHPEMYAARMQFEIRQLAVPAKAINREFKAILSNASSLLPAIDWLNGHQITYSDENTRLTTTDFPETVASKMNSLKKGQIFMYQEGNYVMLNLIISVLPAPLALDAASSKIQKHLRKLHSGKSISEEISRLRSQAKIEYLQIPVSKGY